MTKDILLAEYAAGCEYVAHLDTLDATIATLSFSIVVAVIGGFSALLLARPQIAENRKAFNVLAAGTILLMLLEVGSWAMYHDLYVRIQTVTDLRLMEIEKVLGMKTRSLVSEHVFISGRRLRWSGWLIAGAFSSFFLVYCLGLRRAVEHARPAKSSTNQVAVQNKTAEGDAGKGDR